MKRFIAKRIISVIPVLIIVSIVIFSLIHLVPGDPATAMLGDLATEEDIAALRIRMGLDKPLIEQYFIWIGNIFHGDFGMSVVNNETVCSLIISHIRPTISLAIYALVIAAVIAIPLGMIASRKKRLCDRSCGIRHLPCRNLTPELPAGTFPDVAIFS